jgi:hypothetical protein
MSRGFNETKLAKAGQIRLKLQEGRTRGAGFMIRMENTDTEEEFYVFLPPRTPPRLGFQQYCTRHGHNFNPLECYDFEEDLENQVLADSTQNWDRTLPVQTGNFSGVVPYLGEGPNMPDQDPDDQR